MDEWFEVEVRTEQGWGVVCLPPVSVHGGVVTVEIAKRYASLCDAREQGRCYGMEMRIFRCTETSRNPIK